MGNWESVAPSRRRLVVNGYLGPLSAQFFIKKSFNHLVLLRYSILYLVVLCRRISVLITSSGHIWAWNQSRNCHCHAFLFGLSITIYVCRLDCGYLLFYLVTCLIFDYLVFRTVFKILSQIGSLVRSLFLSSFLRFCPRLVLLFLSSVPVIGEQSVLGSWFCSSHFENASPSAFHFKGGRGVTTVGFTFGLVSGL